MFNTFGSKERIFKGGLPVWVEIFGKLTSGGVLSKLPAVGTVIPAGTPVYLAVAGGKAYIHEYYKALAGSSGTTLIVRYNMALPIPAVGDYLMKMPDSIDGTGQSGKVTKVVLDEENNIATVTLSADPGYSVGDILTLADGGGATAGLLYKEISGLTENDIYIAEGTNTATCAVVWSGKIMSDRIQPVPAIFRQMIPNILFQREV